MNVKWLLRWALASLILAAILTLAYNKIVLPGREKARQAAAERAAQVADPLVETGGAAQEERPGTPAPVKTP